MYQLQFCILSHAIADEDTPRPHPSHRVARVDHIRGSYHEVIDFKLTLKEGEISAPRWERALHGEMVHDFCTRPKWVAKRLRHRNVSRPKRHWGAEAYLWKPQPQHRLPC